MRSLRTEGRREEEGRRVGGEEYAVLFPTGILVGIHCLSWSLVGEDGPLWDSKAWLPINEPGSMSLLMCGRRRLLALMLMLRTMSRLANYDHSVSCCVLLGVALASGPLPIPSRILYLGGPWLSGSQSRDTSAG